MIQFSKHELMTRVLLVENISHMAKIMREMVMSLGFRDFHRVTNVVHAYQYVIQRRPGLIIGEVNIIPTGCARFCKTLRIAADSPDRKVPVILTLNEETASAVSGARDSGANFVLGKPLSVNGLATKIASLLRTPQPFVAASTYTGPERRRRELPFNGDERRSEEIRAAQYRHLAHMVLDIDAAVLSGKAPVPQDMVLEDNDRQLRPGPAARPGRRIMVTQLEEGMELAQSVKGSDGATLVPTGVVLRNDLIAGLCRLVEQGRIPPLISIAA